MPAATTTHEDTVGPWLDDAIDTVAANHPQLVTVVPKFYVGACNWYDQVGPHFLPGGMPIPVATEIAAYYKDHP
jgi:hypothetical protein